MKTSQKNYILSRFSVAAVIVAILVAFYFTENSSNKEISSLEINRVPSVVTHNGSYTQEHVNTLNLSVSDAYDKGYKQLIAVETTENDGLNITILNDEGNITIHLKQNVVDGHSFKDVRKSNFDYPDMKGPYIVVPAGTDDYQLNMNTDWQLYGVKLERIADGVAELLSISYIRPGSPYKPYTAASDSYIATVTLELN